MDYQLKNMMEPLVIAKLDEIIHKCNCCKCERCRLDIISYALNQLPAKYVVTYAGSVYAKLDSSFLQKETDIIAALMKAMKVVCKSPRHDAHVSV